jgi:hypothetical protein
MKIHYKIKLTCSKAKEELILKVPILRQQKIDLLSKYVAILEANKKRWMKIIQKMQY